MKVLFQPSLVESAQSLLNLYLSVYTAGCIQRKSKRIAKHECVLPKKLDLYEVYVAKLAIRVRNLTAPVASVSLRTVKTEMS